MTTREQQKSHYWPTEKAIDVLDGKIPHVVDNPKGEDMVLRFHPSHEHRRACGGCGNNIMRTGITRLAYTFESCSCDAANYVHLVETPWHRECLAEAMAVRS